MARVEHNANFQTDIDDLPSSIKQQANPKEKVLLGRSHMNDTNNLVCSNSQNN